MASYNKSFNDILDELLNYTKEEIPAFTNYTDTDPLVILHKLIAALSVSSNKYSKKYLNSEYVQQPSTIDAKSMYLLLEKFDMIPKKIIPGTIDVIFEYVDNPSSSSNSSSSIESPLITDQLTIPAGTEFKVGSVKFTILEDYYIKAYNSYVTLQIIEGKYRSEHYYKTSIVDNKLLLDSESVAEDYVRLIVDGEDYRKIEYSKYSDESKVFSVECDINGRYNVVLNEQTISCINDSSTIEIKYIESTGTTDYDPMADMIIVSSKVMYQDQDVHGNIRQNTVIGYNTGDTNHTEVNNYNKISSVFPTFRKAVTTEDYKSLTDYFPGVAISASYDINSPSANNAELNIRSNNLNKIVVAPTSGYYMSSSLKNNLLDYYKSVGLSDDELYVELLDPVYVVINLSIGVSATTENSSELLNIYSSIKNAIQEYFKVGNINFGSFISDDYISSLISKLDNKIEYVDILEFSDARGQYYKGYQLNAVELPLLGNLEILFQYHNVSAADSININDNINKIDIAYYLQGNRGDKINFYESIEGVRHELVDSVSISEDRSFGYYSEFDIQIDQNNNIITKDVFTGHYYNSESSTILITKYSGSARTDNVNVVDDTPKFITNSLVSDRIDSFNNTYNY